MDVIYCYAPINDSNENVKMSKKSFTVNCLLSSKTAQDNGERLADVCVLSNLVVGREYLPAQKDTQGSLSITRHVNREPDRPCMRRLEV